MYISGSLHQKQIFFWILGAMCGEGIDTENLRDAESLF